MQEPAFYLSFPQISTRPYLFSPLSGQPEAEGGAPPPLVEYIPVSIWFSLVGAAKFSLERWLSRGWYR